MTNNTDHSPIEVTGCRHLVSALYAAAEQIKEHPDLLTPHNVAVDDEGWIRISYAASADSDAAARIVGETGVLAAWYELLTNASIGDAEEHQHITSYAVYGYLAGRCCSVYATIAGTAGGAR